MRCPDCGAELTSVVAEATRRRRYTVDNENKRLLPTYPSEGWADVDDDYVCRCPNCDSLNVDDMFDRYTFPE